MTKFVRVDEYYAKGSEGNYLVGREESTVESEEYLDSYWESETHHVYFISFDEMDFDFFPLEETV